MSDLIKGDDTSVFVNFISLQYSLYSMTFVAVVSGAFFLATAYYVVADRAKVDKFIKGRKLFCKLIRFHENYIMGAFKTLEK